MGKVLIKMNSNVAINEVNIESDSESGNIRNISSAKERVSFDLMKSYIVIGGLGGIGLEICYWLVKKGVRHLIIISRTGIRTAYHKFCIERMKNEFNANVIVKTFDISNMNEAEKLISFTQAFGPVGGVFNLAYGSERCAIRGSNERTFRRMLQYQDIRNKKSRYNNKKRMRRLTRSFCMLFISRINIRKCWTIKLWIS